MRYLALILIILSFGENKPKQAPPNTVMLTDKLFIDKTPITNSDWQEYLFAVCNGRIETNMDIPYLNKNKECHFVANDSIAKTVEKLFKSTEFIDYYLQDWRFNANSKAEKEKYKKTISVSFPENTIMDYKFAPLYHPVLGVNLKEAEDYCEWRTKVVMYFMSIQSNRKRKKEYSKIQFRVPTNEEVDLAKSKYPSLSEQAHYISKPEFDLKFLNNKFVELTTNNAVDSLKITDKKIGFRCACDILEY
jgi:hypothetical protein